VALDPLPLTLTNAPRPSGIVGARVVGIETLAKKLLDTSENVPTRVIRDAIKTTAIPVEDRLRSAAPRSKGAAAAYRRRKGFTPVAETMGTSIFNHRGRITARIGARYPAGAPAHLTDKGTVDRYLLQRDFAGNKMQLRPGRNMLTRTKQRGRAIHRTDRAAFRGRVVAQNWVRKTFDANASWIIEELTDNVRFFWEQHIVRGDARAARLERRGVRQLKAVARGTKKTMNAPNQTQHKRLLKAVAAGGRKGFGGLGPVRRRAA
jgi:hypothetical protein